MTLHADIENLRTAIHAARRDALRILSATGSTDDLPSDLRRKLIPVVEELMRIEERLKPAPAGVGNR